MSTVEDTDLLSMSKKEFVKYIRNVGPENFHVHILETGERVMVVGTNGETRVEVKDRKRSALVTFQLPMTVS